MNYVILQKGCVCLASHQFNLRNGYLAGYFVVTHSLQSTVHIHQGVACVPHESLGVRICEDFVFNLKKVDQGEP